MAMAWNCDLVCGSQLVNNKVLINKKTDVMSIDL